MKIKTELERKNEALMEKNFNILAEDDKKRKEESNRKIKDACKEAASYYVSKIRNRKWFYPK